MITPLSKGGYSSELVFGHLPTNAPVQSIFFFSANDLRQGLDDRPRWAHIKRARLYCESVDETLRTVEVSGHVMRPVTDSISDSSTAVHSACFHHQLLGFRPDLSADKLIADGRSALKMHFREGYRFVSQQGKENSSSPLNSISRLE